MLYLDLFMMYKGKVKPLPVLQHRKCQEFLIERRKCLEKAWGMSAMRFFMVISWDVWLVVWNMLGFWDYVSIQLGISPSQLTKSYFSEGQIYHQSASHRLSIDYPCTNHRLSIDLDYLTIVHRTRWASFYLKPSVDWRVYPKARRL